MFVELGVAMYLYEASGRPHQRLTRGWEGMVLQRDVVEMDAVAEMECFFAGVDDRGNLLALGSSTKADELPSIAFSAESFLEPLMVTATDSCNGLADVKLM